MGLKVITIYEGLSSYLPALIKSLAPRLTHAHYTHIEYADDPEMQELLCARQQSYPSHITKTFDPHSFKCIHNYLHPGATLFIDSVNLLLSNIYLSNNRPAEATQAVQIVLAELASLIDVLRIDKQSNSTLFLLSYDVAGDWEVRSIQGQAYQQQQNALNHALAELSDAQFILSGANFIPLRPTFGHGMKPSALSAHAVN